MKLMGPGGDPPPRSPPISPALFKKALKGRLWHSPFFNLWFIIFSFLVHYSCNRKQTILNTFPYLEVGRRFCGNVSSAITFDSVKIRRWVCQHRISLLEARRMNYNLTLKRHFENLTSGQGEQDLVTWSESHVAYQATRIVGLNTAMAFSSL